jgi:hypothetical protein
MRWGKCYPALDALRGDLAEMLTLPSSSERPGVPKVARRLTATPVGERASALPHSEHLTAMAKNSPLALECQISASSGITKSAMLGQDGLVPAEDVIEEMHKPVSSPPAPRL